MFTPASYRSGTLLNHLSHFSGVFMSFFMGLITISYVREEFAQNRFRLPVSGSTWVDHLGLSHLLGWILGFWGIVITIGSVGYFTYFVYDLLKKW